MLPPTCSCKECCESVAKFERQTTKGNKENPSVGRIVHYVAYGTPGGEFPAGAHRAAIITEVFDEVAHVVSLCVLNPTGMFFNTHIDYDSTAERPGTWHWPERV